MNDDYIEGTIEGMQELIFECDTNLIKDKELRKLIKSIRTTILLLEHKSGVTLDKKEICKQLFKFFN